jgi:anti-sigma regulatory factor (Ser/Thr protein kinase)
MEVAPQAPIDAESGVAIAIEDSSQVGQARRVAAVVAASAELSETDAGKFAILATEAATNVAKHAGHGELMLRAIRHGGASAVEVIAIDGGPGIGDLERAMTDGYSTAGSPGTGLGAMARIATMFDIFTSVGGGTVVAARLESQRTPRARSARAFDVGVVRVPKRGELACVSGGVKEPGVPQRDRRSRDAKGSGIPVRVARRRVVGHALGRVECAVGPESVPRAIDA